MRKHKIAEQNIHFIKQTLEMFLVPSTSCSCTLHDSRSQNFRDLKSPSAPNHTRNLGTNCGQSVLCPQFKSWMWHDATPTCDLLLLSAVKFLTTTPSLTKNVLNFLTDTNISLCC